MKLKRVWDVTEKKIARVPWANWKPCQVWLKVEEEKFYKQDINGLVEITDEEFNVYWPNWKAMDSDDVLGYYDTNEPTELFSPEDWDEATYTFKDYDETVLKTGKVKDWETPVAPEDPTRKGYTFTGWKPKVKAIYKDTTYTAQYEENMHTVTISATNVYYENDEYVEAESQDPLRATREPVSVQVPYGCNIVSDFSLTQEQVEAGMSSLDFILPWASEAYATILFTMTEAEWFESTVDLNTDAMEETEGIEVVEWESYTIVGDAVVPVYLDRRATS